MTLSPEPIADGERAQSVWMFDLEPAGDGVPLDFRLRDVLTARPGGLPLHPGELVSLWGTELAAGETLLACMQRVVTERCIVETLVTMPGPPPLQTRVRVLALGGTVLVTCEETTLQRRLQHSLTLHRTILDTMCEGVWLVRAADAQILYANAKFEQIMGYANGELAGQPAHVLTFAASADEAQALARATIDHVQTHGEVTYEAPGLCKDGQRIECRATASLLHDDEHGDVVLTVQQDITAQRQTAQERDGFFDNALDMLCIADFDGRFRRLNPAWTETLGWSTAELTGRAYLELVHPDDRARTSAETAQLAEGATTFAFENRYLAIDGSYRVLSWRSVPSMALGVVFACARDITELRRNEQALRDASAEKDTLLKEIHHRVKNNLQVISSLLSLRAETLTSVEARQALQDSQDRVRSIALLHDKLYRSIDLGSINLGEYAEDMFTTLLRTYRLEPAPALVLESQGVELDLDAAMPVGLILNELMTNSLKHAFEASPRPPRIEVTMQEEAGWISILFADNGIGYPHDADGRPTTTLGMELVHTLATQVGGEVTRSNHAGARCQLRFPRARDEED